MIVFTVHTTNLITDRNYVSWMAHREVRYVGGGRRRRAARDALDWLMEQGIAHALMWEVDRSIGAFHAMVGFPEAKGAVMFRLMFPEFPVAEEAA